MGDMIDNAFRYLTRDDPFLKAAIEGKQREEWELMVRKEREVIRCWREYKERWE